MNLAQSYYSLFSRNGQRGNEKLGGKWRPYLFPRNRRAYYQKYAISRSHLVPSIVHELSKLSRLIISSYFYSYYDYHCMYIKITWMNILSSICENLYKRKYVLNFEVIFSKTNWFRMIKIRVVYLENYAMQVLNVQ